MGSPTRRPPRRALRALGAPDAVPDRAWIAALTGASPTATDRVLREVDAFRATEAAISAAHRAAGRAGFAQIRAPFELYALVRLARPRHVVEVGVSSGVSSCHFLLGLRRNRRGRLHSIDLPTPQRGPVLGARESPVAIPPGRSSGWAVPRPIRRSWDLRIGRSEALLPPLVAELPAIDLFLHDDLHTPAHLAFELATIRPKLRPGSIVLADNTAWTGRSFPRFAARLGVRVARRRGTDLVGLRVPPADEPGRR